MKVYSGFGYFKSDKTAIIEICLPTPSSLPNDDYELDFVNVSTSSYNGLAVFVKKTVDNGTDLSGYTLNHHAKQINLTTVPLYSGSSGTAHSFDFSKNFVLIVHHEANPDVYQDVSKQLFQNLNTIATTGVISVTASVNAAGPVKNGFGTIKKQ